MHVAPLLQGMFWQSSMFTVQLTPV